MLKLLPNQEIQSQNNLLQTISLQIQNIEMHKKEETRLACFFQQLISYEQAFNRQVLKFTPSRSQIASLFDKISQSSQNVTPAKLRFYLSDSRVPDLEGEEGSYRIFKRMDTSRKGILELSDFEQFLLKPALLCNRRVITGSSASSAPNNIYKHFQKLCDMIVRNHQKTKSALIRLYQVPQHQITVFNIYNRISKWKLGYLTRQQFEMFMDANDLPITQLEADALVKSLRCGVQGKQGRINLQVLSQTFEETLDQQFRYQQYVNAEAKSSLEKYLAKRRVQQRKELDNCRKLMKVQSAQFGASVKDQVHRRRKIEQQVQVTKQLEKQTKVLQRSLRKQELEEERIARQEVEVQTQALRSERLQACLEKQREIQMALLAQDERFKRQMLQRQAHLNQLQLRNLQDAIADQKQFLEKSQKKLFLRRKQQQNRLIMDRYLETQDQIRKMQREHEYLQDCRELDRLRKIRDNALNVDREQARLDFEMRLRQERLAYQQKLDQERLRVQMLQTKYSVNGNRLAQCLNPRVMKRSHTAASLGKNWLEDTRSTAFFEPIEQREQFDTQNLRRRLQLKAYGLNPHI